MKKSTLLFGLLFATITIYAQKQAVTENGEEVILNTDGTWEYKNESDEVVIDIVTNPNPFTKTENASFLLKSTKLDIGVWLDPKKWAFNKAEENPDAEYELQLRGEDLYAMILTEKVEMPMETLRNIAVNNGKEVSPDLQVVKEEYRTVNEVKVLLLEMDGSMQGIKFTYYGYYFSNDSGTVQFITYTSQKLMDEYQAQCEELLNGFSTLSD